MGSGAADFDLLAEIAAEAGRVVLPHFRTSVAADDKGSRGQYDPVTVADRQAEETIRAILRKAYPRDGIIGEEFGTERGDAARLWVIDPIDGTRSFLTGIPLWGTLVGRLDDGVPAVGMMAQPYLGEVFLGDGDHAEWRRGAARAPLKVRHDRSLPEATLMTTSPAMFDADDLARFGRVAEKSRLVRYGADCYAYCMLAAGQVDLVVEASLEIYDIAPLIPIIEGAGGVVATWDGGPGTRGGRIVAAASERLLEAALTLLDCRVPD
jgi:myo-inositol-1(or 4)-monophosphatase